VKARLALLGLLLTAAPAAADQFQTPYGFAPGAVQECLNSTGFTVPCFMSDLNPSVSKPFMQPSPGDRARIVTISPNSGAPNQYAAGAIPITGNATGTTGAVVGTLAALTGKLTWICGFNVSGIGGTAAIGPITIAGIKTSSMVYQLASTASGAFLTQTFTPCIPASAVNTAITITTTADGTATAVSVNSWGFQQ